MRKTKIEKENEKRFSNLPLRLRHAWSEYIEAVMQETGRASFWSNRIERDAKADCTDVSYVARTWALCSEAFKLNYWFLVGNEITASKAAFQKVIAAAHESDVEMNWQITMCAETNAADTARENGYANENDMGDFWDIALGTIADSLTRPEHEAARPFFAKFGIQG